MATYLPACTCTGTSIALPVGGLPPRLGGSVTTVTLAGPTSRSGMVSPIGTAAGARCEKAGSRQARTNREDGEANTMRTLRGTNQVPDIVSLDAQTFVTA